MLDLTALAVFVAVAERGSFVGASRALGLPTSTVSRHVADLERSLGVRLLHRTTRRVGLTDEGRALLESSVGPLADLEQAAAAIHERGTVPRGRLRVTASALFATEALATWIPGFLAAHPEVEIELDATDRTVDLVAEGYDLAFRVGPLADSSLIARHLGSVGYLTAASPAYLERHGEPATPHELKGHCCILVRLTAASVVWEYDSPAGRVGAEVSGPVSVNSIPVARRLAVDGVGICHLPAMALTGDVAAGRLLPILGAWQARPRELYAVYPTSRHLAPKVRTFLDHAQRQLALGTPGIAPGVGASE
jgi:DNA-binding transcriptional LysR family regulator